MMYTRSPENILAWAGQALVGLAGGSRDLMLRHVDKGTWTKGMARDIAKCCFELVEAMEEEAITRMS